MTDATAEQVQLVYAPPTGAQRVGTVHRTTCQHIPKGAIPADRVDGDALTDATRKTCCSPRMFDVRNAIAARTASSTPTNKENTAMTETTATTATTTTAQATAQATEKAAPAAAKPKGAARKSAATKATATKPTADTKAPAKASSPKATAPKAAAPKAAKPKREVRTFEPKGTEGETFKCQGACGQKLSVKKFPTITGTNKRAVECRPDRDARTKAEKEARAAEKAKAATK